MNIECPSVAQDDDFPQVLINLSPVRLRVPSLFRVSDWCGSHFIGF